MFLAFLAAPDESPCGRRRRMKRHSIVIHLYGARRVEICGDPIGGSKISVSVGALAPERTNAGRGPVIIFALRSTN